MKKFIVHFAAAMIMPVSALAQSSLSATIMVGNREHTLVKTENGCGVYLLSRPKRTGQASTDKDEKLQFQWSGVCVDGLAEGRGVFIQSNNSGTAVYETHSVGFRRAGLPVGYTRTRSVIKYRSQNEFFKDSENYSWSYSYGPQVVGGQGFGVVIPEEALTSNVLPEPQFIKFKAKIELAGNNIQMVNERLMSVTQSAQMDIIRCSWSIPKEQFSECSDPNAVVTTISVGHNYEGSNLEAYKAWRNSLKFHRCPVSTTAEGCEELAYQKAESLRQEIIEFVRMTKPMVEAEMAKSQKLIAGK